MAITSCSNVERAWVSVRKWVGAGAQSVHTYDASVFMDTARDFPLRRLWAAFGFQRTRPAIRGPGAIEENIAIVDPACRVQKLALRAYIDVPILVEGKVLSAQRAIFVLGFLNDRNVRSDPLLVDDPVERRRRSVRSVRC